MLKFRDHNNIIIKKSRARTYIITDIYNNKYRKEYLHKRILRDIQITKEVEILYIGISIVRYEIHVIYLCINVYSYADKFVEVQYLES